MDQIFNAFSVDFEDWFCVNNLREHILQSDWEQCELRIGKSLSRLLNVMAEHKVRGTFFILGWLARRLPHLICEIEQQEHEIALHGYAHGLITELSPAQFEADLDRALEAIHAAGIKQRVIGYRAPSFTIVERTRWALDILPKFNLQYDSSIFPFGLHPDYGIATASLHPFQITKHLIEFPLSCAEVWGMRIPCSGGGYFRLLPYAVTKVLLSRINESRHPFIFYIHPWELDPDQPRIKLSKQKYFRHYINLHKTESRLHRLLSDFKFRPIREVLEL